MSKPRRPRIRRFLKWAGFIACVLIVVALGLSFLWAADYTIPGGDRFCVSEGRLNHTHWQGTPENLEYFRQQALNSPWGGWSIHSIDVPAGYRSCGRDEIFRLPFSKGTGRSSAGFPGRGRGMVTITNRKTSYPLWPLPVLVAIPTAFLWHRDRRRHPPGHCQHCGYNLTGNVSGICSECGDPCRTEAGVK